MWEEGKRSRTYRDPILHFHYRLSRLGITLIELITVVAIIGILAMVAVPSISSWLPSFRLKNTVREIVSTMQLARMKAIARGVEYRVKFNLDAETFQLEYGNRADESDTWIGEDALIRLHASVNIARVDSYPSGIRSKQFNPDGTSSTGSIRLENSKGEKYKITLTTATGTIEVIEGW